MLTKFSKILKAIAMLENNDKINAIIQVVNSNLLGDDFYTPNTIDWRIVNNADTVELTVTMTIKNIDNEVTTYNATCELDKNKLNNWSYVTSIQNNLEKDLFKNYTLTKA